MSNAQLLEAPLAPPKRQSITKAAALQWAENELATMCSDEHTRYEQFFEAAHAQTSRGQLRLPWTMAGLRPTDYLSTERRVGFFSSHRRSKPTDINAASAITRHRS